MAADALTAVVGAAHHGRRVPADVGADAALDVLVAGEPRLLVAGDGVHVGGRDRGGEVDLQGPGPLEQLHEEEAGPGASLGVDDGVEGVDPLRGLLGVDVGELMRHTVEEHDSMLRVALLAKGRHCDRAWGPRGCREESAKVPSDRPDRRAPRRATSSPSTSMSLYVIPAGLIHPHARVGSVLAALENARRDVTRPSGRGRPRPGHDRPGRRAHGAVRRDRAAGGGGQGPVHPARRAVHGVARRGAPLRGVVDGGEDRDRHGRGHRRARDLGRLEVAARDHRGAAHGGAVRPAGEGHRRGRGDRIPTPSASCCTAAATDSLKGLKERAAQVRAAATLGEEENGPLPRHPGGALRAALGRSRRGLPPRRQAHPRRRGQAALGPRRPRPTPGSTQARKARTRSPPPPIAPTPWWPWWPASPLASAPSGSARAGPPRATVCIRVDATALQAGLRRDRARPVTSPGWARSRWPRSGASSPTPS